MGHTNEKPALGSHRAGFLLATLKQNLASPCIFISDLHLCASRPQITASFLAFLQNFPLDVRQLFILGDLFEYWAGDDDIDTVHIQSVVAGFKTLVDSGVSVYLMHGNRDFLIGADFCKISGLKLLQDPILLTVYGKKLLLSHGDDLCTDDIAYQNFRSQVRDSQWQVEFLSQPLFFRKQQIEAIRARSEEEKAIKSSKIMDVNQEAVEALLIKHNYPELLIHGHTHRPAQHSVALNGHSITRWVLGDWYEQGSYLLCDRDGCRSAYL